MTCEVRPDLIHEGFDNGALAEAHDCDNQQEDDEDGHQQVGRFDPYENVVDHEHADKCDHPFGDTAGVFVVLSLIGKHTCFRLAYLYSLSHSSSKRFLMALACWKSISWF